MTRTMVSYDSRAVTINGERILVLSGAIHYPRSTPAMWPDLMQRSREAGLNTIETYVFWNLHERQHGVFDFSEQLDLLHFCQLAQEHGLYVILRVGPYICAETNYGGLPSWLRDVPNIQMRTFNQPFMREMESWVRRVIEYLRPMFAPNGGPIILLQLENEYNNIVEQYGEDGKKYLQWVSDLAHNLNVDVPSIMCLGAVPGSMETINSFYAHEQLSDHEARHPDQPALWTEDWPGWYDVFGAPHRVRSPKDCAYGVARFFAAGGTGVNYYMWHGGTNFDRSAMYLQTTSYDFDAPLNEYGFPTTKAYHLARLHAILHEYAELIVAHSRPIPLQLGERQWAYVYTNGDQELTFLCNDEATDTPVTVDNQHMILPARSVILLSHGLLLFNTAEIIPEDQITQSIVPQNDLLIHCEWHAEPLPTHWPPELQRATIVADALVEQLSLTYDKTDYCWYTTAFVVPAEQNGIGILTLEGVADIAHIFVDGQFQCTTPVPLVEHRGSPDGPGFIQSFSLHLTPGTHILSILTCAIGLIKGDWMLGDQNMVEERKGLWGQVRWNGKALHGSWSIQPGLVGEQTSFFTTKNTQGDWQKGWQQAVEHPLRWWRFTFSHAQPGDPLMADLTGMNKGIAWLNGKCIGRYWLIPGTQETLLEWQHPAILLEGVGNPTQRYYHLPAEWLEEQNTLVLFEELGGDPSQVRIGSLVTTHHKD